MAALGVYCTYSGSKKEYGKYIVIISSVFVIASLLAPIQGGAMASKMTW